VELQTLIELGRQELSALEEFLNALQAERDAIVSFSLEDIVRQNNRKEEILKRLDYLELEKEKALSSFPDRQAVTETEAWTSLSRTTENTVRDVQAALERNKGLLSFSMDHVKSSIDKILGFVNRASYDKGHDKGRSISVMISRKV
jgi:flagellar biosynthesis/type III secretory pathway chaperone